MSISNCLTRKIMLYHVFDGTSIGYDNLVEDISKERNNNNITEHEYIILINYLNE